MRYCISALITILLIFNVSAIYGQETADLENQVAKYEKEGNLLELARCQAKLGYLYKEKNNIQKSIEFFQKAVKSNESLGNMNAVKNLCVNIGLMYTELDNYDQALTFFKRSLKLSEKQGKKPDVLADLINIAQVQQNLKNYTESNQTLERALTIAQELTDMTSLRNCYAIESENYDKLGNQGKAKEYFDMAASIKSHLQKEELKKFESRTKVAEGEVSAKEVELKSKDSKIQKMTKEQQLTLQLLDQQKMYNILQEKEFQAKERLQAARQRNTFLIILSLIIILALVTISSVFILKQLREKKKAYTLLKESNQQIIEQKSEIEKQRDIVTKQKTKITDSILYAQRIQSAVLPPLKKIEKVLPEHFVLFRPRDIVSGDFYWMTEKEGIVIIAAADCTGHGVPGAFMSMLGVAFLNDIVNRMTFNMHVRSLNANEILNQLREKVIVSLHQSGKLDENKDGMDIALCVIDFEHKQMQFAGAHNPMYIIRKGELLQVAADGMPIGVYRTSDTPFTNNEITLEKDDLIYLFSDGFYDQLGGEKGYKIFSANFRKKLLEIHQNPLPEQKRLLEEYYDNWKGKYEQVDDILVIGFKFIPQVITSAPVQTDFLWENKCILIAEDVDNNYFLLAEALKPTKVKLFRAINGKDAVEFCKNNKIDIILMDIYMPIMNGLEATRQIREFNKGIPIIAQTASSKSDDIVNCKEAGCSDYISKPINLKTFLSTIQKHLII
jgi:serine phosphatase RsbU (regulator of sigma subunit)